MKHSIYHTDTLFTNINLACKTCVQDFYKPDSNYVSFINLDQKFAYINCWYFRESSLNFYQFGGINIPFELV